MPVIPTFQTAPGEVPSPARYELSSPMLPPHATANPAAFAAPGDALAQGGAQVSAAMTAWADRYAQARRAADAANLTAQGYRQAQDARFQWSKLDDTQAAYDGIKQATAKIQTDLLNNVQDPEVRAYVTRSLAPMMASVEEETRAKAFQNEASRRRGELDQNAVTYRAAAAAAPNDIERAHAIDLYQQDVAGLRTGGFINGQEADDRLISFRSGVEEDQAKRMLVSNPRGLADILADAAKTQQVFPGLAPQTADGLMIRATDRADRAEARALAAEVRAENLRLRGQSEQADAAVTGLIDSGGDIQDQLKTLRDKTQDMPLAVRLHAESELLQWHAHDQAVLSGARGDLNHALDGLRQSYLQGITDAPVPADDIHRLYPGEQGQRMIDDLTITRQAGDLFKGAQFATPEQEQEARAALAVPGSLSAANMRVRNGQLQAPAGAAPPDGTETPDAMRLRLAVAAKYDELLQQKHAALAKDPAAYVAQSPELQGRLNALAPDDAAALASYNAASLAMQASLGLPDAQRRVLTNAQVAQMAGALANTDPSKADMGEVLSTMQKRLGPNWPRAYGELVQYGKISPDYQLLADMDTPGQVFARQDFQRMLAFRTQKGGAEKLEADAPPDVVKDIKARLDDTLADFRQTTAHNQGGLALLSTVRDGVKSLALYYAIKGDSASTALDKAYDALVGAKYDIDGTMRVPKGELRQVKTAAASLQSSLTADELATPPARPGIPGETDADRRAALLAAAQRGVWVPNQDSSGLVLMAKLRNGQVTPVRRADDSLVALKFDALPAPPPAPDLSTVQPPLLP